MTDTKYSFVSCNLIWSQFRVLISLSPFKSHVKGLSVFWFNAVSIYNLHLFPLTVTFEKFITRVYKDFEFWLCKINWPYPQKVLTKD